MKFSFVAADRLLHADFASRWDELNRGLHNHVLLDSDFVAPLVRHFASPRVLLGVSEEAARPAMALLEKRGPAFWQTFQPSQQPLGLVLLGDREGALDQARRILRALPGFAVGLGIQQQDPDFSCLPDLARAASVERLDYIQTARVRLRGSFDEFWAARGKNLTHNVARLQRRVAERGELKLVEVREPERVAECMREYGRLEQSGWKATTGTGVPADNAQGRFYREMLERFCARGEAVIYRLLLNDRPIAADLCLQRDGMLVLLKTAYDAGAAEHSPGVLLHYEIFKAAFARGIRTIEIYGRLRAWQEKWTDDFRRMFHANVYRGPLFQKLHALYRARRT
jgi:CelD/BcsL family acetyltransferase involved in cellulose biosynthesis